MKFRRTLTIVAAVALGWLAVSGPAGAAERGQNNLTVVELYTSQGCSSCPPADALLGRLAKQDGILALSFHVDYWDYIGWKDPYGNATNSARQRAYKRSFDRSYVYTPQMVINGMIETTGSNEAGVLAGIERARSASKVPIGLSRDKSGGLRISIAALDNPIQSEVWLALFDLQQTTRVRRGENRGRTIKNYNVVREFSKIGEWNGTATVLTVSADKLKPHAGRGCGVFLQSELKGPILGAATINLEPQR